MFKDSHFDRSAILLCVRWYLADNLSLRNLEEMMAERGSRSITRPFTAGSSGSPELLERFNGRKRAVTGKWHVDETYIKVRGQWMYLYRAIDSVGDTVEFLFSEQRGPDGCQAVPAQGARASWPARADRHRRQPDQSGGDHFLRHRKSVAGSLTTQAEADPDPAEPISQQPHRAGSSRHQAAGSTDARLQVDRQRRVTLVESKWFT